jgi:hypothetical protein
MTARIVLHATRRAITCPKLDAHAMSAAVLADTPAQLWDRISERTA